MMKTKTYHKRPLDHCDVCGALTVVSVTTTYDKDKITVHRICKRCVLKKHHPDAYWKIIKERCHKRDGDKCTVCGISRYGDFVVLQAHTLVYRRNKEPNLDDLISVCKGCHDPVFHKDPKIKYWYKKLQKYRLEGNKNGEKRARLEIIKKSISILLHQIKYFKARSDKKYAYAHEAKLHGRRFKTKLRQRLLRNKAYSVVWKKHFKKERAEGWKYGQST